jgi:hypothetical protein
MRPQHRANATVNQFEPTAVLAVIVADEKWSSSCISHPYGIDGFGFTAEADPDRARMN